MSVAASTAIATELSAWLGDLFPLTRSLTGAGNRETLRRLQALVPLAIHEVPSGTAVYDWIVPDEWSIRDAWIAGSDGRRLVDFRASNLHVVSYSEPIRRQMSWDELAPHLHCHPELPEAIPYRTSYYKRTWGFCVTHAQHDALQRHGGPFDVVIDATLAPGSLSYGELLIPGRSAQEILLSCYICHPSMANDSLSGVVLTAFLARDLMATPRQYSYRVVFVPETIGAIAYCATHEAEMKRIDMGLVITTVGGPGSFGYKQSFNPQHAINRHIEETFAETATPFVTYPFDIHGSDERQYSSQGFGLNIATISKDRYYEYPFYHSSLDNLDFVTGDQLAATLALYRRLIDKLDARQIYRSNSPHGEVMLSRHGLYPAAGGALRPETGGRSTLDLILWLLFWCDGRAAIGDIEHRLGLSPGQLDELVAGLAAKGVLTRV